MGYISAADMVYRLPNFRSELGKTHALRNRMRNGCSRSSKAVDFGYKSKAHMQLSISH